MEIQGLKRMIADILFDRRAVLDKRHSLEGRPVRAGEMPDGKGFRLKLHEQNPDAPLSPFYINLRARHAPKEGPLGEDDIFLIGQVMYRAAIRARLRYDFAAGIPYAGEPIALEFAKAAEINRCERRYVPLVRFVKEETETSRRITGLQSDIALIPGLRVVLVDDICTKADTKLEAIRVLRSAKLIVKDAVVLIDREQGGAKELRRAGCRLHAVFTVRELYAYYRRIRRVHEELYEEIAAYLNANR